MKALKITICFLFLFPAISFAGYQCDDVWGREIVHRYPYADSDIDKEQIIAQAKADYKIQRGMAPGEHGRPRRVTPLEHYTMPRGVTHVYKFSIQRLWCKPWYK